jgi:hypothetical protein
MAEFIKKVNRTDRKDTHNTRIAAATATSSITIDDIGYP